MKSFDLEAYDERVANLVVSILGDEPHLTPAVWRERLAPHIDELCEGLPVIAELPSPEQVKRLAPTIGGLLLVLQKPPTMRDIAEYTAASAADAVEIGLRALPNGLLTLEVGEEGKVNLSETFAPIEFLSAAKLHTHPSNRADGTEESGISVHAARVPSPADIDYARTMGPSAQYIADRYGVTHFTSPTTAISAKQVFPTAVAGWPELKTLSDVEIESIYLPSFATTLSDMQTRAWDEVSHHIGLHDLIAFSQLHTGDLAPPNVFG